MAKRESGPKLYLAIDNCFASKRWTRPSEWTSIVKDLGVRCIEASADTECDPLYMAPAYLKQWVGEVDRACGKAGVEVVNLYSGHGTYTTLGLAGNDPRNRRHMVERWLKAMIGMASRLDAGLGFFCHAFADALLQDPDGYAAAERELVRTLAGLAAHARRRGLKTIGVEQMYTPHQVPWTLGGAARLLGDVWARGGAPFYLTIDTGHQSGQRKFLRPDAEQIGQALGRFRSSGKTGALWLGPASAYRIFRQAAAATRAGEARCLRRLDAEMDRFPHLFARPEDGDPYAWLEQLGGYSPIIHLQQTDGRSSSHQPFTEDRNRAGIIHADRVLKAIAKAYAREPLPGLPPQCEAIYLTLEVFSPTAALPAAILEDLAESVAYWRRYIPRDGLRLGGILGL